MTEAGVLCRCQWMRIGVFHHETEKMEDKAIS